MARAPRRRASCDRAQDDAQRQSGGWQRKQRSATCSRALVFYVLTVVRRYSLAPLVANTLAGARCADKTRQAIACEQMRTPRAILLGMREDFASVET